MSITWDEIDNKYPEDRDEMSEEREKAYVNDCFDCYEHEGFSKKFWSPFGDYKERIGQHFTVVERCSTKDSDLSALPMWNIKFSIKAFHTRFVPAILRIRYFINCLI